MDRTEMIELLTKIDSKLDSVRTQVTTAGAFQEVSEASQMVEEIRSELISAQTDEEMVGELAEQVENPAQNEYDE